ncbi:hypothetical protein OGAPHI_002558 [Ogataea philodendri]|uniref:F-box domain-containing protein n=1 Tax=Ogataea philodendri TaxID=1378263 RepID=A0A9P8PAV9_9ASCO|nr:uncharacterized protein OGAPHI_002558 [Ogataea philodendri]KAH3668803.1 hypothetical protein OGAPHI_002558 [Ogataea philodendri]
MLPLFLNMDFPDNICRSIVAQLDTNSLISLAATCRGFYWPAMQQLYRSLLLVDTRLNRVGDSDFTILSTNKFEQFTETLINNTNLVGLIQRFVVCSHSNNVEGLDFLVGLLVEYKLRNNSVPLLGLKEFKILNETTPYKFLFLNKEYVRSKKLKKGSVLLYENDEDEFTEYSNFKTSNTVVSLESYQLVNLVEFNDISSDTREICINTSNRYQDEGFVKTDRMCRIFNGLESLEILNPDATNTLFTQLKDQKVHLHSLTRLSLNMTDLKPLTAVMSCVRLENLESFELKFKQTSISHESDAANQKLLECIRGSFQNLKRLSLIHLNSNNLLKNQSLGSQLLLSDASLSYCIMENLALFNSTISYLNISMNNFAYLPPVSTDYRNMMTHFVVDETYLETRARQFSNLLRFQHLQTLVIPDYFYNWKPFIRLEETVKQRSGGISSKTLYSGCTCQKCSQTQQLLGRYSEKLNFNDNSAYSIYNFLVGLLHSRMTSFETSSGLDILKYPFLDPVEISHYGYLDLDICGFTQLILDNLQSDLCFFASHFPHLHTLCLGGIRLSIDRSDTDFRFAAIDDNWTSLVRRSTA